MRNFILLPNSSGKNTSMRSIFLIVCMCCSLITLAQSNFKVSGIVIGVDKEPIIGATIQDKSNQTGVITDVEGRFTINASSRNAVLRVGYIGMKSEEIKEKSFTKLWALDCWFSRTNDQRFFCAQKGR